MRTRAPKDQRALRAWRQRLLTAAARERVAPLGTDHRGRTVGLACPDVGRIRWKQCAGWAGVDVTVELDGPQAHWLSQHLGVRRRDLRGYLVQHRAEVLAVGVEAWLARTGLRPHVESYVEMRDDMVD